MAKNDVFVFDPTVSDQQSKVRGVGRYLQILKENFPHWQYLSYIKDISNNVFLNPFFNLFQKPLTIKRLAKKQIAVIHDLIPIKYFDKFPAGLRGNFYLFLNKLALKNYDLLITDSQASKKDIIRILKISEEKVKVIYPCLPKIFLEEKKSQNNNLTVEALNHLNFCLYVGDATWNKNLVNLAKAIKIANVTCVFVGKVFQKAQTYSYNLFHPWQRQLKTFLDETKNDKRFIFLGYVNDNDLITLYQKASLNILPSYDEGFGLSYLEASSQSCPSVLADIEVFHEVAQNTALFADPKNPNDLADKIIELYFNKDRQKVLGEEAKKRTFFFSNENFKKAFLEIIFQS